MGVYLGGIYIGIILLMRIVQSLFGKRSSNLLPKSIAGRLEYLILNMSIASLCALALLIVNNEFSSIDLPTIIISSLSGISLAVASFCGLLVLHSGSMALSSMFSTAGLLVPCFAGIFMFGEHIQPLQWAAMALFFVSAYLLILSSKTIYPQFSVKTFLLLITSMLANGFTMVLQKLFSYSVPNGSVSMFSFLTFFVPAVLMAVALMFIKLNPSEKPEKTEKFPKQLVLYALLLAVAVFIINQLATLASSMVSSVVLFTIINGGATIITAVCGALVFKEKLNTKSTLGIILGIAALVTIKAFQ